MKHLAKIQVEFLKAAREWEEMSYDEQKEYLKRHSKSKRKITAKPESKNKLSDIGKILKLKKKQISSKNYPETHDDYSGIFNELEDIDLSEFAKKII